MSENSEDIINASDEKLIEWILESRGKNIVRACEAELQRRIARELVAINLQLSNLKNTT